MSVSIFIARRLSLSSEGRKISPAVGVGVTAVALAILVMACAIAIVTGFKREITAKVAGFNSHITLSLALDSAPDEDFNPDDINVLTLTPTLREILESKPYINDYALQAAVPIIFKTQSDFKGAYIKSLTGNNNSQFIKSALISGKIPNYSDKNAANDILISSKIASELGLKTGDKIDTYFITDRILARRLKVAGIFNSHFEAYDGTFAFGSLPLVQEIGKIRPNEATSIVIEVNDFSKVDDYAADLNRTLIDAYAHERIYRLYKVTTARQSGFAYFHWLGMLDTNVVVVLILMTIVAIITLISGMLILMVDKVRVIALLTALGASRHLISKIFIRLAAKIAILGLIIGDTLSLILLYFQNKTHFIPLDPDSYYIDFVPVEISIPAMIILNIGVLFIIWISLILPSRFAGKVAPARTLARE